MAHTTFTLKVDEALSEQVCIKLLDKLHAVAASDTDIPPFEADYEIVKPKLTVKIMHDHNPVNPRNEGDNVGVMFCRHGRYSRYKLGDEGAEDPFVELCYADLGGYKLYTAGFDDVADPPDDRPLFDDVRAILEDELDAATDAGETATAERLQGALDWLCGRSFESEHVLRPDIAICLPIYMYDHSGITISHGSFNDPWDSGQLGWHYITKGAADNAWGEGKWVEAQLYGCLMAELKEYDAYLCGGVWGFVVEDEEGDNVDSCWGFFGDDLDETGILEHIDVELHDAAHEAWDRRYD